MLGNYNYPLKIFQRPRGPSLKNILVELRGERRKILAKPMPAFSAWLIYEER